MATVKLLTYDVYRSGMTLFKDLADETYQDKAHLPEYFLRKLSQSETPTGYDSAYRLIYRVSGDPDEHVNGDTIGIMGSKGGGVIQSYIVGATPLDADWLSDELGGDPLVPAKEFLYLVLTPGNYYNCFYRYIDLTSTYEKVLEATGDGAIFAYEVAGKTYLDPDWLSLSSGGLSLTPKDCLLYLDMTPGKYQNRLFRFDAVSNKYVPLTGSGSGFVFAYEVTGKTAFDPDWLTDTAGGSSITPDTDLLYLDLTPGKYENWIFRYDSVTIKYVPVSGGSGSGAVYSYIVSGATAFSSGWLSETDGGTALTPEAGPLYLVLTPGAHYSAFYRYDETDQVYILVGNARVVDIEKADYLALPVSKQNDGTIYFVTDSASSTPGKDDYIPARVTVPDNPAAGAVMLWKGAVSSIFDISPAFYKYDGSTWVRDNLGIEGQTIQVDTLPTPMASIENQVVQYIGASGGGYVHNFFYECLNVSGTYKWVNTKVQAGDEFQVDTMPAASADLVGKVYQYLGMTNADYTHDYFYECVTDGTNYSWENVKVQPGEKTQFDVMPTASVDYVGKVYQYIGTTTSSYKHNYFYECVNDSGIYKWQETIVEEPEIETISKTDFEALTTAEKNNGKAYFIPDADSERNYAVRTGFTPVGTVITVVGTTPPRLYLECDGTEYNIADYPELSDYILDQFGTVNHFGGDGVTTFKVPNISGAPVDALYCIAIRDIYINARFDYSTTEMVSGVWSDGKPVYFRTLLIPVPSVSASAETESLMDLGVIVKAFIELRGYITIDGHTVSLPYGDPELSNTGVVLSAYDNTDTSGSKNKAGIKYKGDITQASSIVVLAYYTKISG